MLNTLHGLMILYAQQKIRYFVCVVVVVVFLFFLFLFFFLGGGHKGLKFA